MTRSRAWGLVVASAAASIPLVAIGTSGEAAEHAPGGTLLAALASGPPPAPAWLPKGCRLLEIGPLNTGYTACKAPAGFHAPDGYMLANTAKAPKVHAKSGASGA
jgi:hypothetical protein